RSMRKYGQTVSALSFIGDGSNDSDYLDFIIAAGYEKQVMETFRDHWLQELGRGTVLLFNEIPEHSVSVALINEMAESHDIQRIATAVPCGTVRFPRNWEDYLGMLRPR